MSEPSFERDPFEELAEAFLARYRAGERPSIDELAARHPGQADQIRALLPALVMVEQDLSLDPSQDIAVPPAPIAGGSKRLGNYRLIREIGRGGMGVVYEAEQISLGRRVALKILPGNVTADRKALERFRREAKAVARLHHTNIVPVFEVGHSGDVAYFAMQFIQGQGLDQVIKELRRLDGTEAEDAGEGHAGTVRPPGIGAGGPATRAGSAARHGPGPGQVTRLLRDHRFGIEEARAPAHADADPAAIEHDPDPTLCDPAEMTRDGTGGAGRSFVATPSTAADASSSAVLPGGTVVSMVGPSARRRPFFRSVAHIGRQAAQGLAHAHARGILHRDIKPSNLLLDTAGIVWVADFGLAKAEDDGLTATGDIVGTLRYMAPERFRGEGDARADIYALGLTLYELATLRPAFSSSDRLGLIERIRGEEPPVPRSLDDRIPRDLETIILKAIHKDPARRYPTAEALAEDLRRFLNDETITARRASTAERYARWVRHHPTAAVLGLALIVVLALSTAGSLVVAGRMSELAAKEAKAASAERAARTAAVAETYRAMLNGVKALRAGHEPGWREEALDDLARLGAMATPRRDLAELRTEAAATLGTPDIRHAARVELPSNELGSFTFSRDGRALITAGRVSGLDFWDLTGRRHQSSARGLKVGVGEDHEDMVLDLPGEKGLVVGTADRGVVFADKNGQPTLREPITQGSSRPSRLEIDADGRRIAIAWADGAGVTIHDLASGTLLKRFSSGHFAISPDGRWLAREEGSEIVLLPIDPDGVRVVLGRHGGTNALAFSPDGSVLAVAFTDYTTVLWDTAKREQFGTLRGHRERVLDVAFSPDGDWIATASLDYTTRIWERRTGQNVATLPCPNALRRVAWSPTGDFLAASTDTSREIDLYAITGRRRVQQWLTGHGCELRCLAFHPHRDRLMTSGYQELRSWDFSPTPTASAPLEPHPGAVTSMAFSPDGSLLATASWKDPGYREVLLRDGDTGMVRSRIPGTQLIWALAFDPTGRRLAFCGDAGAVVIWDLATSRPVREFTTGSRINAVAFLDREQGLVTHGARSVILFDIESGQRRESVDLTHGPIGALLVDRTRDRLIVGFEDGAIGSLSLPDLTPGPQLERAHAGGVAALSLSPDGRLLATAGADHRAALRDAGSFEPLLHFPAWAGNIRNLTFDSNGRRLAIVGTDSDIDLWDLAELAEGLAALHLAWDGPEHASGPVATRRLPDVAVIRRTESEAPATLQRAQSLVQSGIGAFQAGRWAAAIGDLQPARDQLRALHKAAPGDEWVASQLGLSLIFLAGAFRNEHRPEAVEASLIEGRETFEALREPSPVDLYNLACIYAGLGNLAGAGDSSKIFADRAMETLRRSLADGMADFALMDRDPDLDPLRDRPDFRELVLDRGFPRDPFARASLLPFSERAAPSAMADLLGLSADIERRPADFSAYYARGQFFARHREWPRALADFREAIRLHPPESWADQEDDTWFGFVAGLVHLQAGDPGGYRRIARAMLDKFAGSDHPATRDRTAKINLIADPPAEDGETLLELADRSVRLGRDGPGLGWLQLTRGMASYRSGDPASAASWLRHAESSGVDPLSLAVAQFYLGMAEHHLGHPEQAKALFRQASQALDTSTLPQDWGDQWFSVAETDLSRREAETLIFRAQAGSTDRDD